MGFLDDYDVDPNEYEESGFDNPPDGTYAFEVVGGQLKEGTTNNPDDVYIVISFNLENEDGEVRAYNWWLKVPDDPEHPTAREKIAMGDWKKWCLSAGFEPSEIASVGADDVEGFTGTVRLVTTKGRGKNKDREYQNPKDWTFDGAEGEEEKPKPARPSRTKKAAAKPAPEPEPDEDDGEEAEAPERSDRPAARAGAKGNPFKKKS